VVYDVLTYHISGPFTPNTDHFLCVSESVDILDVVVFLDVVNFPQVAVFLHVDSLLHVIAYDVYKYSQ